MIKCETMDEVKKVLKKLHAEDFKWSDGDTLLGEIGMKIIEKAGLPTLIDEQKIVRFVSVEQFEDIVKDNIREVKNSKIHKLFSKIDKEKVKLALEDTEDRVREEYKSISASEFLSE